ncbi:glutaminyl-peptide cyclotransferase [Orussus abietinus]|uniref:glutaminyl-peptide cyclotransferase n=1 Tax=Orussus abietinus TaxID=222816 RepID=UPI0006251C52|nr:glutaminyl-peptide cyclotransferase [Orussus abietinus]
MLRSVGSFLVTVILFYLIVENTAQNETFRSARRNHVPLNLSKSQVLRVAQQSNVTHINEVLDNICFERVVGTNNHKKVKDYIKKSMKDLGWSVETDEFEEDTPNLGKLKFENIITKLNPNGKRFLALACHYDSKYTKNENFVGATDSAVPCAQLINLAKVMREQLNSVKDQDISLMFIFFDGEEAFESWGPQDSIYGARHLAQKWETTYTRQDEEFISELDRMDLLVLLDLIGAPDPTFYNYFEDSELWYTILYHTETALAAAREFAGYSYGKPEQRYFQPYSIPTYIEDDHIPFLHRNVSILHIIPSPFPSFWHKSGDNRSNVNMNTTENINKILRIFVASYLHLKI